MEHSQNQSRQSEQIRSLNDAFRQSIPDSHDILISGGIQATLYNRRDELFEAVRAFDSFTPENDPHGEHDCGELQVLNVPVYWKICYYDLEIENPSPDPSDESVTRRVLILKLPLEC